MRLGNSTYQLETNLSNKLCPLDGRQLRYKPPCCSEKQTWLVCSCGYKRMIQDATQNPRGSDPHGSDH